MTVHTGHVLAIYLHCFVFDCSCTHSKHIDWCHWSIFGFWSPVQTRSDFCMCFVYSAQSIKNSRWLNTKANSFCSRKAEIHSKRCTTFCFWHLFVREKKGNQTVCFQIVIQIFEFAIWSFIKQNQIQEFLIFPLWFTVTHQSSVFVSATKP